MVIAPQSTFILNQQQSLPPHYHDYIGFLSHLLPLDEPTPNTSTPTTTLHLFTTIGAMAILLASKEVGFFGCFILKIQEAT